MAILPESTKYASNTVGSSFKALYTAEGSQASVRVSGRTTPASNYLTITPNDSLVSKDGEGLNYAEGNSFTISLSRARRISEGFYIIRGAATPNSNYVVINPPAGTGSGSTKYRVTVNLVTGFQSAEWGGDEDTQSDVDRRNHLYVNVQTTTTLTELTAMVDALQTSDNSPLDARVVGAGATRVARTAVDAAPLSAGIDPITAAVTWDAAAGHLNVIAANTRNLTTLKADIDGASVPFTVALTGVGTTLMETDFSDRSFTGGANQTAKEVVVNISADWLAQTGTATPGGTGAAAYIPAKKKSVFWVPPGQNLYGRAQGTGNKSGSVEVYDSNNVRPIHRFYQGAELTEAS